MLPRIVSKRFSLMATVSRRGFLSLAGIGTAGVLVGSELGFDLAQATEIAHRIADNAPLTNFAVMHALPRIAEAAPEIGYLTEALVASIAQNDPEAKERVAAFLQKRAARFSGR